MPQTHYSVFVKEGRELETAGSPEKAAALYEQAIRQEPFDELPWNRLMVIYRKLKKYKEEARVINRAIKVFNEHDEKRKARSLGGDKKAKEISLALLRSVQGKTGRQAVAPSYSRPVLKWTKRLETVKKKLEK